MVPPLQSGPLSPFYQWIVSFLSRINNRHLTPICRRRGRADKTIKLWKVFEKSLKVVSENNHSAATGHAPSSGTNGDVGVGPSSPPPAPPPPSQVAKPLAILNATSQQLLDPSRPRPHLTLPRMTYHDTIVAAVPRKVYANAHAYHINSISINSDDETYMSADDLRINLWNLGISDQSFSTFASLPSPGLRF